MKSLSSDMRLAIALIVSNISVNMISSTYSDSTPIRILYSVVMLALLVGAIVDIKSQGGQKLMYGMFIYTSTFAVITVASALLGYISVHDIVNGTVATLLLIVYVTSMYKPVVSMLVLNVSYLIGLVELIVSDTDALGTTYAVPIISFIALCWVVYRANKSIGEKGCNKEKLLKILNYENKPVKIKLWMHIVIWSMVVTSIMAIANTEMLELMNKDVQFAAYAAMVVLVPTFLVLASITGTVLVIEFFVMYVVLELYTVYSLFILRQNISLELPTVLVDIAVLIYMVLTYKTYKDRNIKGDVKDNA